MPGDLVELEIAPQIKRVLYFNARKKLEVHKKKQQEMLEQRKEDLKISTESEKSKSFKLQNTAQKSLINQKSTKVIEKKNS